VKVLRRFHQTLVESDSIDTAVVPVLTVTRQAKLTTCSESEKTDLATLRVVEEVAVVFLRHLQSACHLLSER